MKRLLFVCIIFSLGAMLFSSSAYATASSAIDAIVQKMSNGNTKEAVHQYLYFDGIRFWMILASLFIASGVISLAGEIASSFGGAKLGGGVGDASSKLTTTVAKGAVGLAGKGGHHTKGLVAAGAAGLGAKFAHGRLTKSAGARSFVASKSKGMTPVKAADPSQKNNETNPTDENQTNETTNPQNQNDSVSNNGTNTTSPATPADNRGVGGEEQKLPGAKTSVPFDNAGGDLNGGANGRSADRGSSSSTGGVGSSSIGGVGNSSTGVFSGGSADDVGGDAGAGGDSDVDVGEDIGDVGEDIGDAAGGAS